MRVDFINGELPESVTVDGVIYPVNHDFRTGMMFDKIRTGDGSDEDKLVQMLKLYYPQIPENIEDAVDKMIWFYLCGEEKEEDNDKQRYQRRGTKEPAFSFSQDTPYIYAAFKEQYNIDLTACDMHWWKFMALFESLNEDTKMSRIMYYRKANTSGMSKEKRAFINDMKKLYRITNSAKTMSLEERNRKWREHIEKRHQELNQ